MVLGSFVLIQTAHTLLFIGYFIAEQIEARQFLIDRVPIGFLAAWFLGLPLELYMLHVILRSRRVSWGLTVILTGNVLVLAQHEWAVGAFPHRFILVAQLLVVPFVVLVSRRATQRLGIGTVDWVALGCTLLIGLSCFLLSWRYFPVLQEWEETPGLWQRMLWESRLTWPTECNFLLFGVIYLCLMWIFARFRVLREDPTGGPGEAR
jgi:hypothetical protein